MLLFGVCVGLLALVELEAGLMPVLFLSSLVLVSLKTWAPMLFVAGFVEAEVVQWVVLLLMCVGVFVLCEWGFESSAFVLLGLAWHRFSVFPGTTDRVSKRLIEH